MSAQLPPSSSPGHGDAGVAPAWAAAQAMRRAALAVSQPGGPDLFADLVRELAASLGAAVVFVAVFVDEARSRVRTLAARLDGGPMENFDYLLAGSPCAHVVGNRFRYVARGVAPEFPPGSLFAKRGMDAYAAYPLNDSAGTPLGLLVAIDRSTIADEELAESLLKIFASRMAAEIERSRTEETLRAVALAVSSARGDSVFAELVRYLATLLRVETAFIARHDAGDPQTLQVLAMHTDGQSMAGSRYTVAGTPCSTVLGQRFRAYPHGLRELFPDDPDVQAQATESYAGHPLHDLDGAPLGIIVVASRQPLVHVERIEAMLQIFAVRAAAEIERLRAEEALQRSEASYRAIFEAAEDAIFIHDWDSGAVLDVNPKACETFGYAYEELCRASVADVSSGVPPYTGEEAKRQLGLAKLGRCPPFEWHRRNKDGSLHWDEVRLKPLTIRGRPHIVAFTREITERKAAEEALRLREEQYRAIFDGSADALVLWSREILIVDTNPAFTQMYGYTRDEVVGGGFGQRLPRDGVSRRVAMIEQALAGREGQLETRTIRKDGSEFDVELRYLPIRYRGEPHVLAVARDITERHERDAALQRSEARLRATVEAAFDCVVGMDDEGRIVEFNAAAERCFGHRRSDVMGRPLGELIIPERHRSAHARGLRHFHHAGQGPMVGRLVETSALRADGSEFPVEMAISVAQIPEGSIFVGHLRDISARRRAEAQRGELESQLRQAQKMEAIGQLTGGIAHDFNNILTSVIGYTVMAGERAEALGDATLVRQLGQAQLAAGKARDLVAQMLAFARRQRGDRRVFALAPLVRQAAQLLRATLPSSVVLDVNELDADPEESTPPVLADAVQIEQVLFNLCINARDAMAGAGHIRVNLRESGGGWCCQACGSRVDAGHWVELSVADNGCGIAPEVLERMFDPFYSTKEVGRGSGMGLAMVHGIVHDHHGHVRVDTRLGHGTTFRVLLPAAQQAGAAAAAPLAVPAESRAAAPLRGRVLLVEDQTMVGDFLAELLESWGLSVVLLREPLAALAWLEDAANEAALLITDHTMPQLTGLELARRACALRPTLPVVLVSGNAEAFDPGELVRCGVRVALRKPIVADRLRTVLREALAPAALPG